MESSIDFSVFVSAFFIGTGQALVKVSQKMRLTALEYAGEESAEAAVPKASSSKRIKDTWAEVNSPSKLKRWLKRMLNPQPKREEVLDPLVEIRDMFQFADKFTAQKLIPAAEAAGKAREALKNFETAVREDGEESETAELLAGACSAASGRACQPISRCCENQCSICSRISSNRGTGYDGARRNGSESFAQG